MKIPYASVTEPCAEHNVSVNDISYKELSKSILDVSRHVEADRDRIVAVLETDRVG